MPIKEKRMVSPRYIGRIITYTLDISFLIVSLSAAQSLYELSDVRVMQRYLEALSGESVLLAGVIEWYAKGIAAIVVLAFLGLLLTLRRLVAYELTNREDAERLMFACGYRITDMILYEEGYVMFDLALAYTAAGILLAIAGAVLANTESLSVLSSVLERRNCVTVEAYLVTLLAVVLVIGISTALQVGISKKAEK